jgi:hypothetical protein
MPKIFISYRRADTGPEAGRLRTDLVHRFGEQHIFRDKESIPPGVDWREEVRTALSGDTVVLALIGKTWITGKDASGQRILDSSESNNRLELELALRENLKTIPVLVEGAEVPKEVDLPDPLRKLLTRNAARLRDDDWDNDARRIFKTLESFGVEPAATLTTTRPWFARPMPWLAGAAFVALVAVATSMYKARIQPDPATPTPVPNPIAAPPPAPDNVPSFQIVVDRSDVMNERFGTGGKVTKLDAAKQALVSVLQEKTADTDHLSLREFGGECSDLNSTRLVLPFAPGESRLAQQMNGLTPTGGKSTLVNAIVEATGDFSGRQGKNSGIIVIAGSYDGCGHPDPDGAIQQRLKRYPELTLDLRFIGVALTRQAQSLARDLARKTGGTFRNATNPNELQQAFQQALIVQTRVSEVQTAVEILTVGVNHLNTAVGKHLGAQPDYNAADREVSEAEQALKRTVVPAPEAQQPEGVRRLLDIARQAVEGQRRMLDATKALIAAKKAGDVSAEAAARGAYNSEVTPFNQRLDHIDNLRKELLAK